MTSEFVVMLLVASAREFVLTRPVILFWGLHVFEAASKVAFTESRGTDER